MKSHKYITVVSNSDTGTVLHGCEGRTKASLRGWYDQCSPEQLEQLESVSMDMCPAHINTTLECVPGAMQKIAFDRFHVLKKIGGAVDQVRRDENRTLKKEEDNPVFVGIKYKCLTNTKNMSAPQKRHFKQLKTSLLKTART